MKKTEYLTVSKTDPRYFSLLEGRSDDGRVALPMKSFSAKKSSNWATFALVEDAEEKIPSRPTVIFKGIRPLYLTMTLTSPALCLAEYYQQGQVPDWLLVSSILLCLTFLHFSIFLFNDYKDHIEEVDRNQSKRKRGIIQRGWATAREVKRWAYVNFVLGAICSVPAVLERPAFVLGMGAIVVLTFLAVSQLQAKLSQKGLNEYLVSLSLGPLLAYGFSYTVFGGYHVFIIFLCVIFGWLASLVFQTKYLEEMVATYQNKRESLIARMGFDKSKSFITVQLIMLPVVVLFLCFYFGQPYVAGALVLPSLFFSVFVVKQFKTSPSPMSSNLVHLSRKTAIAHLIMASLTVVSLLVF